LNEITKFSLVSDRNELWTDQVICKRFPLGRSPVSCPRDPRLLKTTQLNNGSELRTLDGNLPPSMELRDPTKITIKSEAGVEKRKGTDNVKITSEICWKVVIR